MPTVPTVPPAPFELLDADDPRLGLCEDDLALARAQLRAVPEPAVAPDADAVQTARRRILDFADANPDALWRTCGSGHLTGSAVVVDRAGERVLLLHHAKLGRWLQPGGHADGDGNLANVALREAMEETGIEGLRLLVPAVDIDIHTIPARGDEPEHVHLDLRFAVVAPEGAEVAHNHESLGARWLAPDAPGIREAPDLDRAVRAAVAAVRSLTD